MTLHSFQWGHRRAEIGFWLAAEARRRGYARRACASALDWLFEGVGVERGELTTTPENVAAQQTAVALGFVLEGTLRDRCLERGRRVSELMYGLLRDEWRAARAS